MRDLVSRFLNNGFSRRDFAKQLMALGFTASAAASILEPLEAMEASRAVAGAAAGGEKVISGTGGELVPGELIRWQVFNQCNIVTFRSPDRLDFSFPFLIVTDFKDIRAGRHFRSG
jgi:hypothetical protein